MGLEQLRSERGLSQTKLAELLVEELTVEGEAVPSVKYTQKRISDLENDKGRPSTQDLQALAVIFEKPLKEMEDLFPEKEKKESHGDGSPDLFAELKARSEKMGASSDHTLLAMAYGGARSARTSARSDDDLVAAIIHRKWWAALFVPYPGESHLQRDLDTSETSEEQYGNYLRLLLEYKNARMFAFQRFETLRSRLPENMRDRIALYEPRVAPDVKVPLYLPPFTYRQMLIVTRSVGADPQIGKHLFAWKVSSDVITDNADHQMVAWTAWFGEPVAEWTRGTEPKLSGGHDQWSWKLLDDIRKV